MKKALLIVGVLIIAAACSKGGGSAKGASGDYVAKVGDVKLTQKDVQVAWDALPAMAKQVFQGPGGTARFVDELARRESLYLEAKKKGLDQDKEVQMKLEETRKNALVGLFLKKMVEDDAPITDKASKEYYESHKDEFTTRDKIRVSQIVVKAQDDVKKVSDRLKAGEDFAKIASAVSVDKATAKSGGDLGFIDKDTKLAPQLVQEILKTKKGEVSSPVTMPDGIHILKVTDIKGTLSTYEDIKGAVSQRMIAEKRKVAREKLLDDVKKNYKIDINKDAVAKLPPLSVPDMPIPPGHPSASTPDNGKMSLTHGRSAPDPDKGKLLSHGKPSAPAPTPK